MAKRILMKGRTDPVAYQERDSMAMPVARDMASGAAFAPHKAAMAEASSRQEANMRAESAAVANQRGMVGQGMGDLMAQSTENLVRRNRFDSNLNQAIAEQEMRERGARLGMQAEMQGAQRGSMAANVGLANRGMEINELQHRDKMAEEAAGRELQAEGMKREYGYRNRALEQQGGQFQQGLELQRQEMYGNQSSQRRQDDLMKSRLELERELGTGQLDVQKKDQELRDYLGREELGLNKEISRGELALKQQQQEWAEEYGQGQLGIQQQLADLQDRALTEESRRHAEQLDFQYKQLDRQDQQFLKQLDLGYAKLTKEDEWQMRQMGITEKGIEYAKEFQDAQIQMAKDRFEWEKSEADKDREDRDREEDRRDRESQSAIEVQEYPMRREQDYQRDVRYYNTQYPGYRYRMEPTEQERRGSPRLPYYDQAR